MSDVERTAPSGADPLRTWSGWTFLAAMLALALGTILAIAGVGSPALFLPGVRLLQLALLLLAASGVLRAAARDD